MDEKIIARASEIIFSNEGGYASVNRDDNGALSLGRLQWHGTRALNLCKKIIRALGEEGALRYISAEMYREISTSRTWSHRTLGEEEGEGLGALLSTSVSREVQDAEARGDVCSYLEHICSLGVSEERALIFMADIENQGGAGASRRIISSAEGTDIDSLYRCASADRVFKNYIPRRARVYEKLTGHPYGEGAYEGETYEVRYGDTLSEIAREYGVSVREIAQLNNISNPSHIRTGDLLRIPVPTAVQDNTAKEDKTSSDNAHIPALPHTYSVGVGDTLSGIGAQLGIPWRKIAEANGIGEPYRIYAGQVLSLPREEKGAESEAVRTHTVVRGDTLSALALRYNTTVAAILGSNRARYRAVSADYIVVGWELVIPGGAE